MANNEPALLQQLDEQKGRLELYEKKLKDVVKAYKSLQEEKKALETALSAMSGESAATSGAPASASSSSESQASSGTEGEPPNQIDALKQALTTLTVENKKKELAMQSDRRALLQKNDDLQKELEKWQSRVENQRKLKETIRQMEAENERLMSDHGKVIAEMQQSYAKERIHADQVQRQLTELYKKVQEKEDQMRSYDARLKEMAQLEAERDAWKKKADGTPTLSVLRQELANTKTAYEKELETLRHRTTLSTATLGEKDDRIADLEGRVRDVTAKGVRWEEERVELQNTVADLQNRLKAAEAQVVEWKRKAANAVGDVEEEDSVSIRQRIRRDFDRLRELDGTADPYDILGLERPPVPAAEASLHSANADLTSASASNENVTTSESTDRCDACHSAQKDLEYFKSLIGHLQKKIRVLEEKHESTSSNYEKVAEVLRKRVTELEAAQENTYHQLTTETKRKVTELEDEMQRQRARMIDIISEKDKEIEVARQSLATLYSQRYGSNQDPVDPPQRKSSSPAGEIGMLRNSAESIRSALVQSEDVEYGGDRPRSRSPVKRSLSNYFGDARNVFYEQELMKREQEIAELRNVMRLSEMKVRDMEQAMLTKDIQCLHLTETLKEEIRVLEGRLKLCQSETNMEYLRNIFVQFVNSPNAKGRKHILKAIGAVLKLTATEMRKIDSWSH